MIQAPKNAAFVACCSNLSLIHISMCIREREFNVEDGRVEYIFYCDVEFYVRMFGHSYPAITQRVELTGYHNTKSAAWHRPNW